MISSTRPFSGYSSLDQLSNTLRYLSIKENGDRGSWFSVTTLIMASRYSFEA